MTIRSRLLLFLLPILIGSITFLSTLFAINWNREIKKSFHVRLSSAVATAAALIDPEELDLARDAHRIEPKTASLSRDLARIRDELDIDSLYIVPIHAVALPSIPTQVSISKPHLAPDGHTIILTGYAPIYDSHGYVMGLMAADIPADKIQRKFQESLLLILLTAGATLALVTLTLFALANRISKPVQQLNNSALAIAAGQYGESIHVEGPKEIVQLANTLNTMSECLHENINRLKENSLLRERMYGEYECALLLQHMMLQNNIDQCRSDAVGIKPITFFSENPRGLLLNFPKTDQPDHFLIHLAEAEEEGFEGMYELLSRYRQSKDPAPYSLLTLDCAHNTLSYRGAHPPFVWSLAQARLIPLLPSEPLPVESGDLFFLYNSGLRAFFKHPSALPDLLSKVLKLFAQDGLDTTASMLHKELHFALKRKEAQDDLHLIAFQLLNI
jgi:HAMP domain-containing protein